MANRTKNHRRILAGMLALGLGAAQASAALTNYWPLNEVAGTNAPNTAGGTNGTLFNGVAWVNDGSRGQVLNFDGVDGFVNAGSLPGLAIADSYTWSFWSNHMQGNPPTRPNDVVLGNRFPDAGWTKFTPTSFESRDNAPNTYINNIDIPDLNNGEGWRHQAVVKRGNVMTYYRNGLAFGNVQVTKAVVARPFYFGGDTTNENWTGRIDDVATWNNAMPSTSIAMIAQGLSPNAAPLAAAPASFVSIFNDDFETLSVEPTKWNVTNRGLENNGPAGYNAPDPFANLGAVTLSGTAANQYWFGSTLESVPSFNSNVTTEVTVDRVALSGSGVAYRSSLWILGDDGHYLHFSHNVGETGWSFNARDDGGTGTYFPTGGGFDFSILNPLESLDQHEMKLVVIPTGVAGRMNVEMYIDDVFAGAHGFSNFPSTFKVAITGQAREIGASVNAVFDNVNVSIIPLPTAAWAGLALLGGLGLRRRAAR